MQRLMNKGQKRKNHYLQMLINQLPVKQLNNKRPMNMTFKNISKWNRQSRNKERPCSLQEYLIYRRLTNIQTNSCIRSRLAKHQGIDPLVKSLCHRKEICTNNQEPNICIVKLSFTKGRILWFKSASKSTKFQIR